jgi:uncharacterized protein
MTFLRIASRPCNSEAWISPAPPRFFAGVHATRATHGGSGGETRFITAGFLDGRLVVMVWTPRGAARHIMSMRYAHAKEQKLWKEEMDRFR